MAFSMIYGDRPYWLQYIFDGKGYQFSIRQEIISKNGGSVNILLRVGKYPGGDITKTPRLAHVINRTHQVEGGGHYDIEILEGVTVADAGTQINYETTNTLGSFSNLNRQSEVKQDSILDIYYDCTYTGGIVYDREFIQAGGLKGDTGEFSRGTVERVLKPNTDYVIKITNTSTSADGVGHAGMTWYESGE